MSVVDTLAQAAAAAVGSALGNHDPIVREAAKAGIELAADVVKHALAGASPRDALVAAAGERGFVEVERLEDERAKRKFPGLHADEKEAL